MSHHKHDHLEQARQVAMSVPPEQLHQPPIHHEQKPRRLKISTQEQSSLFARLPLEVRRLIYTYTLVDPERELGDRIRHFAVEEKHFKHRFSRLLVSQPFERDVPVIWGPLLACWRMYCEAVQILYSEVTFDFTSDYAFLTFVSFTRREHLKSVRRLNLDLSIRLYRKGELWLPVYLSGDVCETDALTKLRKRISGPESCKSYYETLPSPAVYRAISKLPGLRELTVQFKGLGYHKAKKDREAWDAELLAPLLELENAKLEKLAVLASWTPVRFGLETEFKTKSGFPFQVAVDRAMFRHFAALLESLLDWEL